MNLNQLSMFKHAAESGSLRRANEQLNKAQPAISQGIRQLEARPMIALINRDGYRLELTDTGKFLYQHALRGLEDLAQLREAAGHYAAGNETQQASHHGGHLRPGLLRRSSSNLVEFNQRL